MTAPSGNRSTLFTRIANARQIRVLSQKQFGLYTLGNGISLTGSWMQRIAMLWLVWEMTGSGFWLGLLATADMLPILLIGPFAGVAADRWNRLAQTRISQYVHGAVAALFAVLIAADMLSLAAIMVLAAVNGSMIALNQPARMALVQSLVDRQDVGTAVALSSVNVNLARLTGPAIAGIMIVHLDIYWVFFLNAALTFAFVVILHTFRVPRQPAIGGGGSVMGQIRDGIVFVAGDRGIRMLLLLLFLGGAGVRAIQDLFPAFAERNFESGATGLAFLTSGMAIGAVAAGLTFAVDVPLKVLARRVAISWALGAVALAALVFSFHPMTDAGLTMVVGFFVTRGVIGTQTFVQLRAPDEMRGRTLSVHGLVSRASPALGALATGWAFDRLGLTIPVLVAAGIVIAAVLFALPVIAGLGTRKLASGP